MKLSLVRISLPFTGEVAGVESPPTKAAALDNMAQEQMMNPASEADKLQYSRFTFDATHLAIGEYWKSCYRGIIRANFVINNENLIRQIPENERGQPPVTEDQARCS
mgnify:CR=1 FL=1